MQKVIAEDLRSLIRKYVQKNGLEPIWEPPLVRCAEARDPLFARLKEVVVPSHYLPEDYLPGARTVISWFIPFRKSIADGNRDGFYCSAAWAGAYLTTNAMAAWLNERLAENIRARGGRAAIPHDTGMISRVIIRSRWSQKHVAWIAGHGSFGLNNMLIFGCGLRGPVLFPCDGSGDAARSPGAGGALSVQEKRRMRPLRPPMSHRSLGRGGL